MNKALHVVVYAILIVAAFALYFEYNLYGKKELLKDRNRQLEDYIVNISKTIEKADAPKAASAAEALKDVSPVEAKEVDEAEKENLLEGYQSQLEAQNLDTLKWDDKERVQLRQLYKLDGDGNRIPDAANPGDFVKKGPGTAQELLDQLFDRAKAQQARLNTTRAALAEMRTKLEALVAEYNKLKPEGRKDKMEVEKGKSQIAEVEQAKATVEDQLTKTKAQIDDLNAEIKSLKDEKENAKDETAMVKEELDKTKKNVELLTKLLKEARNSGRVAGGPAVDSKANVKAGNKGKVVEVNQKLQIAVVEFTEEAMKELLGAELQNPLPAVELGIRREGLKGPAGEYVGRLSLRKHVAGKNLVIADILGDWLQTDEVKKGDVIFAE